MNQTIEAIYENGVLRPIQPLMGLKEHDTIKVTIELSKPASRFRDLEKISDEDAAEMIRVIEEEFEQVDPDEWK